MKQITYLSPKEHKKVKIHIIFFFFFIAIMSRGKGQAYIPTYPSGYCKRSLLQAFSRFTVSKQKRPVPA